MGTSSSKRRLERMPADPAQAKRRKTVTQRLEQAAGVQVNAEPLLDLMRSTPDDAESVIAAIERCPVLTGRLLSVINSAAFGLPRSIESVRRAVLQLGPQRARSLALAFAMRVLSDAWQLPPAMAQHLWVTGLVKACAARLACEAIDPDHADDAFCVSLLQDIGLPLLIQCEPEFYETQIGVGKDGTWCEQEIAHFGIAHPEVGASLLRAWGAPASTCDTVQAHHDAPATEDLSALPLRVCAFVSSLIPHFGEPAGAHEREWLIALHGQFLSQHHASPDAFLDAAHAAAKQIHGNARPPALDAAIVSQLAQLVCNDTAALVGQICRLEDSLGKVQKQTSALRFAARTDPLTGVLNRRGFFELGEQRVALAASQGKAAMIMAVDIDNFKQINDTHGHDAGDRMLSALAHRLRDNLGSEDLIGRIGGDEFVMLVVDADEQRARDVTQRLNQQCNGTVFKLNAERSVTLRFSLGSLFCEKVPQGVGLDVLLNSADEAMYRRKRDGKAGFVFVHYSADVESQPRPAA